jgi:predicted ATPase/class 3 adenylate cyclase
MNALPTGTVTFLFTDIEGSTQLWEQHPEAMKSALAKHDSILKEAIESHHGHIIKTTGDGIHAVFTTAIDSVNASIAAQRELHSSFILHNSSLSLKVRMGLHTGEAELRDNDYFGQTLNRAARIMSAGHGGQILISEVTAQLALEHFANDISLLDLGEHYLKGLLEAEKILQVKATGLPSEFPPLNSTPIATNNIPTQLTSFIGRERELTEAESRLEGSRLLTLIGPGGTGKTRLSLELASRNISKFADGVWLIELAPIADPALILQAAASVLNVRAQAGMPLMNFVADYLRAKQLLLIFDNCEHLVEASASLAEELLHLAPNIKILASSREALGIAGETVYRVPSLSMPNQANVTRDAALGFESVRLFADRASAANPKFKLTDENASSVAQICSRLDGIPLALELAASRVSAFTPEQIAKRLDDRFKLLTGGSRTALPRQQTLRALIDWSYDILSEPERKLLRQLSVFAGGWVFDAAETICAGSDVLTLLPQLVNKSLVTMDDEGDEPRYRLLETIRQYARDKLLEAGEAEELRNLHLEYHARLTETAEEELYSTMALKWVNRLEADYDNIRAAFEWGMEKDVFAALRMGGALPFFWFRRGYEAEALPMLREALERAKQIPLGNGEEARARSRIIAKAWQGISFLAFSQGDVPAASAAAQECARMARQLNDVPLLAFVLTFEAESKMMSGHFDKVEEIVKEVQSLVKDSNDPFALGMASGMIGTRMMLMGGDEEKARALVDQALQALKNEKNIFGHTILLFGMAMGARYRGRFEEARKQFVPLLQIFQDMGDFHRANMVQSEMAHMERAEGKLTSAGAIYRETILVWKRLGHRAAVANQLECYAFIAKAQEQPERAVHLLGAAEALREMIQIDMSQLERVEYEREVADLKKNMSEADFNAAWEKGRSMTLDEAVELALG